MALVLSSIGFHWFGTGTPVRPATGAGVPRSGSPSGPPDLSVGGVSAASTFEVLGGEGDIFGNRSPRGYAFVIHTGAQTTDLLTDYHLVVEGLMQGSDTLDLRRGDQTSAAKIVAVSPDPHVALLRINGVYPALPISGTVPAAGDTIAVGEAGPTAAPHAAVISYPGRGGASHLTFSMDVPAVNDGDPVLDRTGQVVGIAEPTAPFGVEGVGFAVPIRSACLAVEACW